MLGYTHVVMLFSQEESRPRFGVQLWNVVLEMPFLLLSTISLENGLKMPKTNILSQPGAELIPPFPF
jgi:hypothetical protein